MSAMRQTFVIVEDHAIVREGLRLLLEMEPDWKVVGEADSAVEGVELVSRWSPTCMIVDMELHGASGMEAIKAVRAAGFAGTIVMLTGDSDPKTISAARAAGADAYVWKVRAARQLKQTIEHFQKGDDRPISEVGPKEAGLVPVPTVGRLSKRELEVLHGLVEGQPVKAIAFSLGLSPKTVEAHRAKLMLKLNVTNLADLTRLAMREGLVRA